MDFHYLTVTQRPVHQRSGRQRNDLSTVHVEDIRGVGGHNKAILLVLEITLQCQGESAVSDDDLIKSDSDDWSDKGLTTGNMW